MTLKTTMEQRGGSRSTTVFFTEEEWTLMQKAVSTLVLRQAPGWCNPPSKKGRRLTLTISSFVKLAAVATAESCIE